MQSFYQAALKATEKLDGKIISSTYGDGGTALVDAFPFDAVARKLMFGARPGVTLTVVTGFMAHLEHHLGLPPAQ